ncbi:MAG TPA: aldehyde ferredoxin oxidoreductase, partial [Firmicutes bacterium]|nr:aldehyde ferredoxin oxidoreductase [Bacillota bacterium]
MYHGYMGKILFVNLHKKSFKVEPLKAKVSRSFIGGTGLAAYIISNYQLARCSALDPKSPLVFSTGPLTGTISPSSGRFAVAAKSPLTNLWGDADCGGFWGPRLKAAGYDAIVVEGRSDLPVYLFVSDSGIEILDATGLWGLDTFKTTDKLVNLYTNKASVVCIGPAGEKMIPIACIMSEGHHARAAGRCGLGAVMGSKNLKAIVVKGSLKATLADSDGLKKSVKQVIPKILQKTKRQKQYGTAGGVIGNSLIADMSAKNWTDGAWFKGAEKISGEEMAKRMVVGNYHCPSCVVGCGKTVRLPKGPFKDQLSGAPEYETLAGFGSQLLIDDLDVIAEANDLCNRYGFDTISFGGGVAFIFEAVEKGFLQVPPNYPPLKWGNGEALIFLIHEAIKNQGLGVMIG